MTGTIRGVPDVTVMVTTYDGASRIVTCLDSLAAQTLAPDRFEILIVQNGPPCDTPAVVADFSRRHPQLRMRLVELLRGGLGHARNVGLHAARGRYVTYVDDDDWITPHYLEAMLRHASADVVPVALVSARVEGATNSVGGHDFDNYAGRNLLRRAGRTVTSDHLTAALNYNAGKLVPTDLARQVPYDESLRSGEDLVYWLRVLSLRSFRLHVVRLDEDAVYCRLLRPGSLGRQSASYDFMVTQRFECLKALEAVPISDPVSSRVAAAMARGQAGWINNYLREHPGQRNDVVADAHRRGLRTVPWWRVNRGLARTLLLHSTDTTSDDGGLTAFLRVRDSGDATDVIADAQDWAAVSGADRVAAECLGRTWVAAATADHPDVGPDVAHLLSVVESWEDDQEKYRSVVTTASSALTTIAAATLRASRPDLQWEAWLGRPAAESSGGPWVDKAHTALVRSALGDRSGLLPRQMRAADLRVLTMALADRIVVDSEDEFADLCAECPDPLRERLRQIVRISPPSRLEGSGSTRSGEDCRGVGQGGRIRVAWLHARPDQCEWTRRALDELGPDGRERVELTLLNPDWQQRKVAVVGAGLADVVRAEPVPDLVCFLESEGRYDVLILPRRLAGIVDRHVLISEDLDGASAIHAVLATLLDRDLLRPG